MEPIDAGDIPLGDVVRELFSEKGLRRLLGRYDTACFVLVRSGLQRRFFQELIENIDTVDETTRDSVAFIVFHGNQSSYIREDDYRYSFHLEGLSISRDRERGQRFGRSEDAAFARELRHRIKTAPDRAPFVDIGRATDFAATLIMQRFDVRETSLPCLLFVTSSRMEEPQVVQLLSSEPMESLYRDVLAPLSDELRLVKGLRQQRNEISFGDWQYKHAQKIVADFPTDLEKLNRQLEDVRAEINRILAATPQSPFEALRSERANLDAVRQKFKSAKTLDERIALAMDGPYAAEVIEIGQKLDVLIREKAEVDGSASGEDTEKRRHALSSSIGRLKSKLGSLATKPASQAADRINRIDVELRKIEAAEPVKSQRETEGALTRRLSGLKSSYEDARRILDTYSEAAIDVRRRKATGIEEQLRRHGFSNQLLEAEEISAFDVVEVLNRTGTIGHSRADGKGVRTRAVSLSAAPKKMLLLFLHGLGGAREATWGKFPSLLMSDQGVANRYAVDFYTFPTQIFRLPFFARAPKIQVLADGLRTQIKYAGFERVSLVCHSLGGLIAKQYLIEELEANRALRVDHVAFFAVPNNGSDLAAAGALLSWRQHQLQQLQKDADIIEFSNKAWRRLDIRNKVRLKYIVGSQDRVVDRLSAEEYWGNPDVETVLGKGHIDIVKPNSDDDMVVKIMRHILIS